MVTYKAHFRLRRRHHSEDIADMVWPFMDSQAKEERVVDQVLLGMDNHELSVQVIGHGHRRTEDLLRIARSLEVVHEEEKHASHPRKPAMQARFVTNGPPDTPGPKRVHSADRRDVKPASRMHSLDS